MQLFVAAYGWQDEAWGAFYPADLPDDWRLDYYANLYRTIVLPAGEWQSQDDVTLRGWLEDAPETFLFFWELDSAAAAQRLLELYRATDNVPAPGGWLSLPGGAVDGERKRQLTVLAPVLECQAAGDCADSAVRLLGVAPDADLRQVRQQIDTARSAGVTTLVMLVKPAAGAERLLAQLDTLCQLYDG